MDPQLVQRTRYVLRSRFRRVTTCPLDLVPSAALQLVSWLDGHPTLGPICARLKSDNSRHREALDAKWEESEHGHKSLNFESLDSVDTLEEHAAVALFSLTIISGLHRDLDGIVYLGYSAREYLVGPDHLYRKAEERLERWRDDLVETLYHYLDEQLDSRIVVHAVLDKYKQRSEWFHGARLRKLAEEGGERALAWDAYSYLLDQGVEFFIEPASRSGSADLVMRLPNGGTLEVDAKFVPDRDGPAAITRKLAGGVHQVTRYCDDWGESYGFLLTFVDSAKRIVPDVEEVDGLRFVNVGGKTIYLLFINIRDLPSASRAGKAEEVAITRGQLIAAVPDDDPVGDD